MLTNLPPIRDQFGQYYRICSPMDAPATIQPRDCLDEFMTRQFLHSVDAPFGLWGNLLHRYDLSGSGLTGQGDSEEQAIARLLAAGRLVIYPVADPAKAAAYSRRATFSKSASAQWRVAAPDAQNTRGQKKHFRSKTEALTFLTALNPGAEQLHAMQQMADASRTSPATIDRVAADLASNKLVVIEEPVQAAATAAQSEKTSEADEPQSGNHAQEPGLGPESITPMPAANDEEETGEEPVCAFTKLSLSCDHLRSRRYLLDGIKAEPNVNGVDRVIQVISKKDEPDHIKVAFSGTCVHGNDQCPSITISGGGTNEIVTASPHKFPVLSPEAGREVNSFTYFLRHYMVPSLDALDHEIYTIKSNGCADMEPCEAKVHAFSTFKWGGSVSAGYKDQDGKQSWGFEGRLKGEIGNRDWKIEAGIGRNADDFFPNIRSVIDDMLERLREITSARVKAIGGLTSENTAFDPEEITKSSITWPQVSLGGNVELQEIDNSHSVGFGGELFLKMDPLIKADLKIDIIDWLVIKRTPHRKFFRRVRKRVREGVGTDNINASADLVVELSIEGGLEADLKWERAAGKRWRGADSDKSVEMSTSLLIGLRGHVEVTARMFYVKAKAGVEIQLQGASSDSEGIGAVLNFWATTANDKPRLGGRVEFTGAAIYYAYYAEFGATEVKTTSGQSASEKRRSPTAQVKAQAQPKEVAKVNERVMTKLVDVFKPNHWPKQSASKQRDGCALDETDL